MGKLTGFMEIGRQTERKRSVQDRINDYKELYEHLPDQSLQDQAARCMDCGIPFCHSGCPLGNLIPDFNDLVYKEDWQGALEVLHRTNNFPEFTGRLCPAPCEHACVLGINADPVAIETIEKYIVEKAFEKGWITPQLPEQRTGKKVAIIGSGPAGLAAGQQLNRAGHSVTIFERDAQPGGLLRYGVPDFKMEKHIIDRRLKVMEAEGIAFKTNAYVGKNVAISELKSYDAVLLANGATVGRKLPIPGADATGVVQAMHFLKQQNKRVEGSAPIDTNNYYSLEEEVVAKGKNVIVIGGGDTGSDCIGTSIRQGAKSVVNFELLGKPPVARSASTPWPLFALKMSTSTSHEEGAERNWSILTKEFLKDASGQLTGLKTVEIEWITDAETGKARFEEVADTEKIWPCDLVLIAIGFSGVEPTLAQQLGVELDPRGNQKASLKDYKTNLKGVFAAGDSRRGQSLIVWAISEGREAAFHIDEYLMGKSYLPQKGQGDI
ncbi:MAG: glutamate synthase subunit beta [Saprospiraceae bacterium]|nr:glutamate synthase subunit beta [Saprospiraceae bacterium]